MKRAKPDEIKTAAKNEGAASNVNLIDASEHLYTAFESESLDAEESTPLSMDSEVSLEKGGTLETFADSSLLGVVSVDEDSKIVMGGSATQRVEPPRDDEKGFDANSMSSSRRLASSRRNKRCNHGIENDGVMSVGGSAEVSIEAEDRCGLSSRGPVKTGENSKLTLKGGRSSFERSDDEDIRATQRANSASLQDDESLREATVKTDFSTDDVRTKAKEYVSAGDADILKMDRNESPISSSDIDAMPEGEVKARVASAHRKKKRNQELLGSSSSTQEEVTRRCDDCESTSDVDDLDDIALVADVVYGDDKLRSGDDVALDSKSDELEVEYDSTTPTKLEKVRAIAKKIRSREMEHKESSSVVAEGPIDVKEGGAAVFSGNTTLQSDVTVGIGSVVSFKRQRRSQTRDDSAGGRRRVTTKIGTAAGRRMPQKPNLAMESGSALLTSSDTEITMPIKSKGRFSFDGRRDIESDDSQNERRPAKLTLGGRDVTHSFGAQDSDGDRKSSFSAMRRERDSEDSFDAISDSMPSIKRENITRDDKIAFYQRVRPSQSSSLDDMDEDELDERIADAARNKERAAKLFKGKVAKDSSPGSGAADQDESAEVDSHVKEELMSRLPGVNIDGDDTSVASKQKRSDLVVDVIRATAQTCRGKRKSKPVPCNGDTPSGCSRCYTEEAKKCGKRCRRRVCAAGEKPNSKDCCPCALAPTKEELKAECERSSLSSCTGDVDAEVAVHAISSHVQDERDTDDESADNVFDGSVEVEKESTVVFETNSTTVNRGSMKIDGTAKIDGRVENKRADPLEELAQAAPSKGNRRRRLSSSQDSQMSSEDAGMILADGAEVILTGTLSLDSCLCGEGTLTSNGGTVELPSTHPEQGELLVNVGSVRGSSLTIDISTWDWGTTTKWCSELPEGTVVDIFRASEVTASSMVMKSFVSGEADVDLLASSPHSLSGINNDDCGGVELKVLDWADAGKYVMLVVGSSGSSGPKDHTVHSSVTLQGVSKSEFIGSSIEDAFKLVVALKVQNGVTSDDVTIKSVEPGISSRRLSSLGAHILVDFSIQVSSIDADDVSAELAYSLQDSSSSGFSASLDSAVPQKSLSASYVSDTSAENPGTSDSGGGDTARFGLYMGSAAVAGIAILGGIAIVIGTIAIAMKKQKKSSGSSNPKNKIHPENFEENSSDKDSSSLVSILANSDK